MTEGTATPQDDALERRIHDYFTDRAAAAGVGSFEVLMARAEQARSRRRSHSGWGMAAGLALALILGGALWRVPDGPARAPVLASAALTGELAGSSWWRAPTDRLLDGRLGRPLVPVPRMLPPAVAPARLPMERLRSAASMQGG